MDLDVIRELIKPADTKIVFLVMDGLGGLCRGKNGPTELESARTPNLDNLAALSICGLHSPVAPGITPGSGPAHLGVFGYDPLKYVVGRGVLSALGVNFDLRHGDVAARGNFCTLDEKGRVEDRRAGRISTEKNQELCEELKGVSLPGVEVFVQTVKEHRMLLVLRGDGLSGRIEDTDPQQVGALPDEPRPRDDQAKETAELVKEFLSQAHRVLAGHHPANGLLLRGFAQRPNWPSMKDAFGVRAAAIAGYPMYRGLGRLLGMEVLETGAEFEEEFATLEKHWGDFDFFYLHIKPTDSAGEDGDFDRKMRQIEKVDALVPRLMKLEPDVVVVTGDHSTPSALKAHSWHPVPTLVYSRYCRPDNVKQFGERYCMEGGLGPNFPAVNLMPIALSNALRLEKYGA